jgi:hypothetical protein
VKSRVVLCRHRQLIELLLPDIQQPSLDPQRVRQLPDMVVLIQPLHDHLLKGLRKLAHAFGTESS